MAASNSRSCCFASLSLVLLLLHTCLCQTGDFIEPVPLVSVRLAPNSAFDRAASLNIDYLLSLHPDDLLLTFRQNAGLDAPGTVYSGSWEDPTCEVRGHFVGHYLSAIAMLSAHTGNQSIIDRGRLLVNELRVVQSAFNATHPGYLSAFPIQHFERLFDLQPVWAPFYVIHKIMAGLLDLWLFAGNQLALQMVIEEADFFHEWVHSVIFVRGLPHWVQMLDNEFGGMAETLFTLHSITNDSHHLSLAYLFTKPSFYGPLNAGIDPLGGIHANTHLAQVNGFAAGYELEGNTSHQALVGNFFRIITSNHTFATGGSNDHEFWGPARTLADSINLPQDGSETEEICTQYNILKIARYLFRWTGAAALADFYERAILNGLIGTQRMPPGYQASAYTAPEPSAAANAPLGGGVLPLAAPAEGTRSRTLLQQGKAHGAVSAGGGRTDPAGAHHGHGHGHGHAGPHRHLHLEVPPHQSHFLANWRPQAFTSFPGLPVNTTLQAHVQPGSGTDPHGPGRLIYLLPLGAGLTKGSSSHNWGDPLHSFWCCYGSGVESMAKLADSIFFWRQAAGNRSAEVYINQLVPATLSLKPLNLRIQQEADLFEAPISNLASANLTVEPLSGSTPVTVALKLRLPGWLDASRPWDLLVNGVSWKHNCSRSIASEDLPPLSTAAPFLGTHENSTFCTVHRAFHQGDSIKLSLPLGIRTEPVQDSRPEFAGLQAVMLGPLVMAGLTHSARTIAVDPAAIARRVYPIEHPAGSLVSFRQVRSSAGMSLNTAPLYLRRGFNFSVGLDVVPPNDNGAALDASFVLRPFCSEQASAAKPLGAPLEWSQQHGGPVVLESLNAPGRVLAPRPGGGCELQAAQHCSGTQRYDLAMQGTPGRLDMDLSSLPLQASNSSGAYLSRPPGTMDTFAIEPALGKLPPGARVLSGDDVAYVIVPIGHIVDEQYTAYFQFV